MTAEQNKTSLRRLLDEVVNGHKLSVLDEVLAPDFVEREELGPGIPPNREGTKQFFAMTLQAFPDLKCLIQEELAEDNKAAAVSTWNGTQKGEFLGIPPTGKPVSFQVIDVCRFENGKIVEHWGEANIMAVLTQLGAVPEGWPMV